MAEFVDILRFANGYVNEVDEEGVSVVGVEDDKPSIQ
jgi:hypothetical protein